MEREREFLSSSESSSVPAPHSVVAAGSLFSLPVSSKMVQSRNHHCDVQMLWCGEKASKLLFVFIFNLVFFQLVVYIYSVHTTLARTHTHTYISMYLSKIFKNWR